VPAIVTNEHDAGIIRVLHKATAPPQPHLIRGLMQAIWVLKRHARAVLSRRLPEESGAHPASPNKGGGVKSQVRAQVKQGQARLKKRLQDLGLCMIVVAGKSARFVWDPGMPHKDLSCVQHSRRRVLPVSLNVAPALRKREPPRVRSVGDGRVHARPRSRFPRLLCRQRVQQVSLPLPFRLCLRVLSSAEEARYLWYCTQR